MVPICSVCNLNHQKESQILPSKVTSSQWYFLTFYNQILGEKFVNNGQLEEHIRWIKESNEISFDKNKLSNLSHLSLLNILMHSSYKPLETVLETKLHNEKHFKWSHWALEKFLNDNLLRWMNSQLTIFYLYWALRD